MKCFKLVNKIVSKVEKGEKEDSMLVIAWVKRSKRTKITSQNKQIKFYIYTYIYFIYIHILFINTHIYTCMC